MRGELWQECERRGCHNEPACVDCFYCEEHCVCDGPRPFRAPEGKALVTGNTYPVKDKLKALGGTWSPEGRGWLVPAECEEEARRLVSEAGPKQARRRVDPATTWVGQASMDAEDSIF